MKFRIYSAVLLSLAVTGCTTGGTGTSAPAPVAAAPAPAAAGWSGLRGSCGQALSQYKAVIDNDLATGHVNKTVYTRILGDLSSSVSACQSGQDGASLSQLTAVKARYGYPVR